MDKASRNDITRLKTEPYRRLRRVGVIVAVIGVVAATVLIVLAATHSPILDALNGYRMSSSSDASRNSFATATIIAFAALATIGGPCAIAYATYKLRLEKRLAEQSASRRPANQTPAARASQLATASRQNAARSPRAPTGKRAMFTRRIRAYTVGDRVRVWLQPGARGAAGEVVALRPGGVVFVALDGQSGTVKPKLGHMDLLRPGARRRQGLLMLGASIVAIVAGTLLFFGVIPVPDIVRGGVLVIVILALFGLVLGILALRDARDPLAPLTTYDPNSDNSPVWVD